MFFNPFVKRATMCMTKNRLIRKSTSNWRREKQFHLHKPLLNWQMRNLCCGRGECGALVRVDGAKFVSKVNLCARLFCITFGIIDGWQLKHMKLRNMHVMQAFSPINKCYTFDRIDCQGIDAKCQQKKMLPKSAQTLG